MQGTYVTNNNNQGYKQYVVKKDDSLYKIAKDYNTTVDELVKINHLPSNTIYLNQILFIPAIETKSNNSTYLTKEGDSIGDVLNKFKISMRNLDEYNDLDKLKLKSNQLLYVGDSINQTFIITNNISIEEILNKYNITALDFLKLNEDVILTQGKEYKIKKLG